jgi:hypothetical protein
MKLLNHLRNSALAMSAAAVTMVPTAFAASLDATSAKIVKAILDLVQTLGLTIGIILLAWSVVMLILAFKNEDADSKSRAIMLLVVSIALIGIGGLIKPILQATGVTGIV